MSRGLGCKKQGELQPPSGHPFHGHQRQRNRGQISAVSFSVNSASSLSFLETPTGLNPGNGNTVNSFSVWAVLLVYKTFLLRKSGELAHAGTALLGWAGDGTSLKLCGLTCGLCQPGAAW